ncbi:hypothetical protein BO82DRAFT_399032 [Aspergillus uvarum CBS 121591]|uniref:Uncharacterized protein n=1 Tax=Aspergillus uvarum CBS 121591 TaxID=1448315 RepID=A0A319E1V4_9EURO|nr:hypothetical protein BO82DRAFT_399032 [Aspergillus uvarum CBS 121591]PYH85082.1 hypothetical protein BO82DRAFT_399032 [Aspergillus uvarum CBS 121591]
MVHVSPYSTLANLASIKRSPSLQTAVIHRYALNDSKDPISAYFQHGHRSKRAKDQESSEPDDLDHSIQSVGCTVFVASAPAPAAPAAPAPPAGTPRATWDQPAPRDRSNDDEWGASRFVELPAAAWFSGRSVAAPAVVPGLLPWTGSQPLSGRERAWIREPVVRSSRASL